MKRREDKTVDYKTEDRRLGHVTQAKYDRHVMIDK